MPEYDNDRLEQFFRKATGKPDVTFNEDDWKKLEARLDAEQAGHAKTKKAGSKIITAVAIAVIMGFSGAVWLNAPVDKLADSSKISDVQIIPEEGFTQAAKEPLTGPADNSSSGGSIEQKSVEQGIGLIESADHEKIPLSDGNADDASDITSVIPKAETTTIAKADNPTDKERQDKGLPSSPIDGEKSVSFDNTAESLPDGQNYKLIPSGFLPRSMARVEEYDDEKIFNDLIRTSEISPAIAEKIKQKAVVELPGAEEETTGAEAVVREEHASEQKEHESLSRLSLLLSFAPDFSSTVYNEYTTPGKAFGAMIHYHLWNRWSISAGAIKNNKEYTGAGEDYQPPRGYWKYYTNGVIPNSIDGSCTVLEFPVMVQYTIARNGKSKWLASVGASSYLMLDESYRYHFEQPNPGAKEGWDSRSTSRFLFNMANIAVGYERSVLPELMIGIEPYIKVPLEEIGWSNLRLFSTGASITLRYTIVRRQVPSTPARSRGPD